MISKLIVTKFKGEIDFSSEYGKGSRFQFTFRADLLDCDGIRALQQSEREEEEMKMREYEKNPIFGDHELKDEEAKQDNGKKKVNRAEGLFMAPNPKMSLSFALE